MTGEIEGVIRHRHTGDYYTGAGNWSPHVSEAMQFGSIRQVVAEVKEYGLNDFCEFVVALTGSSGLSISFPI